MINKMPNIHPGEILFEEFLKPMSLSQNKLASELKVPARRINEIVLNKRRITVDTAIRLGKYFDIDASWWLNLQNLYDLEETKRVKEIDYIHIYPYKRAS